MTIADLVTSGSCSAACIAATSPPTYCKCPCDGELHGAVAAADVTTLVEARRAGLHRRSDLEVLAS